MQMSSTPYTRSFFDDTQKQVTQSAQRVVPVLMQLICPSSVVDVGCGTGLWLKVFREAGVAEVLAIDGDYVQRDALAIEPERFMPRDLSRGHFEVGRQFGLATCLEVGEHLPEAVAGQFVESLTALAPVVAFSAAVPGQGGVSHVNEQWPEYWARHFRSRGFVAVDRLRCQLWNDEGIAWYYRQNLILYVREDVLEHYPSLRGDAGWQGAHPLPLVHPGMYQGLMHSCRPENMRLKEAASRLGCTAWAGVRRRLGKAR